MVAQVLLGAGAKLSATDKDGDDALENASVSGHETTQQILRSFSNCGLGNAVSCPHQTCDPPPQAAAE